MTLWRGGPNTRTLPTVLLTPSASKAADMAHLCVPQNQALGVCREFVPDIQICGTHGRKDLVNATTISNAEEEEEGYKMWALTTPLGYLSQIEPYQGARGRQVEAPCLGMGGSVVVDLISELQQEEGRFFHLTFHNLFTSLKPADCLSKEKTLPAQKQSAPTESRTVH